MISSRSYKIKNEKDIFKIFISLFLQIFLFDNLIDSM